MHLRALARLPEGTAQALDGPDFPIPVMAKARTTSDFRDALFLGSTYGSEGITVAVRIGFEDNSALREKESGQRAAPARSTHGSRGIGRRARTWGIHPIVPSRRASYHRAQS